MNEQVARDVVLVRAIETVDQKREILSEDDRMYASRSARELAQWQAAEHKTEVTADHFLQQRSEQIIKRLSERSPGFAAFARRRHTARGFSIALPLMAVILGAGADRITDPHRVDLLSAPLLAIMAWNLFVYLAMFVWALVPSRKTGWAGEGLVRRLSTGKTALPRKLPHAMSAALTEFVAEWTRLSFPLTRARISRTFHLSAALFATGAIVSLYARGLLTQYAVGWESTFLGASQVQAILSLLFTPAMWLTGLPGFSVADIEALRFTATGSAAGGARWVHLYAATLILLVVVPRLVLAAMAHWQATRRAHRFPLDLQQPYFRKLGDKTIIGEPGVLRVIPYSFTLDEARHRGLTAVAAMLLGDDAQVMLRPPAAYGDEPADALQGADLNDPAVAQTAVLFNLAATPENENHGAFLAALAKQSTRPVTALIDESGLLDKFGNDERHAQRIALWQEFCRFHKVPATIVNLLHPDLRAVA